MDVIATTAHCRSVQNRADLERIRAENKAEFKQLNDDVGESYHLGRNNRRVIDKVDNKLGNEIAENRNAIVELTQRVEHLEQVL